MMKDIEEKVFGNFKMSITKPRSIVFPFRMLSGYFYGTIFDWLIILNISSKGKESFELLYLIGFVVYNLTYSHKSL